MIINIKTVEDILVNCLSDKKIVLEALAKIKPEQVSLKPKSSIEYYKEMLIINKH